MFKTYRSQGSIGFALNMSWQIFHATVRSIRQKHRSPIMCLLSEMLQSIVFVAGFLLFFQVLGLRGAAIRGDFVIYIMSGIFLFMTHNKAVTAVASAEGPASAMMQHAPMNTAITISSAALGSLYLQTLSMFVILFIYYVVFSPFVIDDPIGAFLMFLLAWFTGCAVGLLMFAIKPWAPTFTTVLRILYQRANMIASGKMFVANTLPSFMLAMFDWNPLFHAIDQARGFAFINYNPHNSSIIHPINVGIALMALGFISEYYTRKKASSSWSAKN